MNCQSFDYRRIAEGYANDRPFLHGQVAELLKRDLQITRKFSNGLDIGCGAGLSTKALKLICDNVTGTDISAEMIEAAKNIYADPCYTFLQSSADEIKAWFEDTLTPVFDTHEKTLMFEGYYWYIHVR